MTVMDERKLLTIKVTPTAKQVVEQTAADRDMKELGVASRIYEWFGQQEESVRRAVMGFTIDQSEVEKARKAFQALDATNLRVGSVNKGEATIRKATRPR
jgi:hypothetical protein